MQAPTIDVQRYVRDNITPYDGDASFLRGPTPRTLQLWDQVQVGRGSKGCRAGRCTGPTRSREFPGASQSAPAGPVGGRGVGQALPCD